MSKAGRKKKRDGDVLRAGDIVPPYGDAAVAPKKKTSRKKTSTSKKTPKTGAKRKISKAAGAGRNGSDIPQLDLDKQILAKQRKVTSVRRKGPGAKRKAGVKPAEIASLGRRVVRAVPELPEQDRIIADIVARDIQRLSRR